MGPTHDSALWERRARRWLNEPGLQMATSAVVLAVVAVVSASQLYANWVAAGVEVSFWALLAVRLADWLTWALAVPLVVHIDRFLRRRPRRWPAVGGVHILAATGWFAAQNLVPVGLAPLVDPASAMSSFVEAYFSRGLLRLSTAWVVYAFILAGVWLLRDFVRRQELARDLHDAQLRALRAQIQPHFLFNTLHTVGSLVRKGQRQDAIETIVSLSQLLRRSLSHARQDEVPLEEELEFLDAYLTIQRARFGSNLVVCMSVDPAARGARVPPLILQPLVENAIRHGLDLDARPGTVRVSVAVADRRLLLRVEDDGGRLDPDDAVSAADLHGGVGLSNLRDRLERLYGHEHAVELGLTDHGATAVCLSIPLRGR